MSTIYFPCNQVAGPIAFNASGTAPTEMYIYPSKFAQYIGVERVWGWDDAGTLTDGALTDFFDACTTDPDLSSATLEYDDDSDSPYKGELRVMFTMS